MRKKPIPKLCGLVVATLGALAAQGLFAAGTQTLQTGEATVREATQSLLTFLTFSAIPDSTADSLQIDSGRSGDDPRVKLAQVGGGFTLSEANPIYLEGYLGYASYDPNFVISGVGQSGVVQARWKTFSATGGIGYDFPLAEDWVLRPIANFSLSHMTSDATLIGTLPVSALNASGIDARNWLDNGWLTSAGIGGSLVLDFERRRPEYEVDFELRYRRFYLTALDSSTGSVDGSVTSNTAGMWARLRVPTGHTVFERPLRVVLEGAHSWFANNQTEILGFEQLTKVGAGLEFDVSDTWVPIDRVRIMGRYVFGDDISGVSIGFGLSL